MKKLLEYWKNRLSHPLRGMSNAARQDSAIQLELIGGIIFLIVIEYFFGPFSAIAQLLLIFCFFLILITELQNSAIETALDKLHPERNEEIGHSKDLTAGAVVTAGVFGLICLYFVLSGKL